VQVKLGLAGSGLIHNVVESERFDKRMRNREVEELEFVVRAESAIVGGRKVDFSGRRPASEKSPDGTGGELGDEAAAAQMRVNYGETSRKLSPAHRSSLNG